MNGRRKRKREIMKDLYKKMNFSDDTSKLEILK